MLEEGDQVCTSSIITKWNLIYDHFTSNQYRADMNVQGFALPAQKKATGCSLLPPAQIHQGRSHHEYFRWPKKFNHILVSTYAQDNFGKSAIGQRLLGHPHRGRQRRRPRSPARPGAPLPPHRAPFSAHSEAGPGSQALLNGRLPCEFLPHMAPRILQVGSFVSNFGLLRRKWWEEWGGRQDSN